MLKQFIREITENEYNFLSNKDDPPHFESIPEVTSSIMWVKDLLTKISKPTTQICAQGILSRRKVEVQERFKKTEALYTAYMLEKYNNWKIIAEEKLNKFLHSKVLKKVQPQSIKSLSANILNYKVNFLTYLEDVSIEAKILEHMGYEVPIFVRNITLQERIYYKYRNKLKIILKRMENALLNLKTHEIKLLSKSTENLCIVLQQGTELQWESSEISIYLKKLKKTVDVFAGIMTQAKSIFCEIEKQIKKLSTFQLFTFTDMKAFDNITNCEVFFERAEAAVNGQIKKVVETYNTLPPLLKNLEQVTCQTATGKAKSLSQYYSYCEENILLSLIEMMIMNLKYLKDELWDQFFIPNIHKFWYSNDELDKLSFARIKWAFVIFMKNISECTRNVKRWLQGTCIESPTFFTRDAGEIEFSYYLDLSLHPKIKELVLCIISWFLSYMKKLQTE
ncbi:dynein axonemal heavy chain 10-like [Uloborus diversus]|uniref:dynein axonemal heavy chain 10-like n=1 Tax=Uloborus diversus TaxID=327109 RepID=UPI00240905FA|nr:dynein axonemal heavy chain 10-like [Uloborus diversus]